MTGNSQNQDGSRKGSPDPDPTPPQGQDSPSDLRRPQGDPQQSSNEGLDTSAIQPHVRKLNLVGSSQITRAVAEAVRRGLSRQFVVTEAQIEEAVKAIGGELL